MLPEHKPSESDALGNAIPASTGKDGHIVLGDEDLEYMVVIPDGMDVSAGWKREDGVKSHSISE
jgi:hypothetical protein